MPSVSGVCNTITRNTLGRLADLKLMKKFQEEQWMKGSASDVLSGLAVGSIVVKDGVGMYLYVTQAKNNEKIPKDKRGFVAAIDLVNGVLMMSLQIAVFFIMKKHLSKWFDDKYADYFNRAFKRGLSTFMDKNRSEKLKPFNFHKEFNCVKDNVKDAYKVLLSLLATTFIAKRTLVPLIATPMADWARKHVLKDETVNDKIGKDYDYFFIRESLAHGRYKGMRDTFFKH